MRLSFMFLLTLNKINIPLPALTNNPAHTAGNVMTPSMYIVVSRMDEAQLGIMPTKLDTSTDLFGCETMKLYNTSCPMNSTIPLKMKVMMNNQIVTSIVCMILLYKIPWEWSSCSASQNSSTLIERCLLNRSKVYPAINPTISLIPKIGNIKLIGACLEIMMDNISSELARYTATSVPAEMTPVAYKEEAAPAKPQDGNKPNIVPASGFNLLCFSKKCSIL